MIIVAVLQKCTARVDELRLTEKILQLSCNVSASPEISYLRNIHNLH